MAVKESGRPLGISISGPRVQEDLTHTETPAFKRNWGAACREVQFLIHHTLFSFYFFFFFTTQQIYDKHEWSHAKLVGLLWLLWKHVMEPCGRTGCMSWSCSPSLVVLETFLPEHSPRAGLFFYFQFFLSWRSCSFSRIGRIDQYSKGTFLFFFFLLICCECGHK